VHLKRRRVACELLALRWDGSEAYWDEVCSVIDTLAARIRAAAEAIRSEAPTREKRVMPAEPPWKLPLVPGSSGSNDFAPRSSERERLAERITSVQAQLEVAWRECEAAQSAMASKDGGAVERAWGGLKGAVGNMVRDVERGREAVRAMQAQARLPAPHDDDGEGALGPAIDIPLNVPDFVREWTPPSPPLTPHTPPSPTPSSPVLAPDGEHGDALSLPAVGRDEVFEAQIIDTRRDERAALGRLSREERVALAKQARERGVTLGEMMRRDDGGDAEREREKEKRRAQSGVVLELEGLMGMIRARKGGEAGPEDVQATSPTAQAAQDTGWRADAEETLPRMGAQSGGEPPRTPSPLARRPATTGYTNT
jgi:hypothetical protein